MPLIRVEANCSVVFVWLVRTSSFIFKIHTRAVTCNYPSTIFRFESNILLKSERHTLRNLPASKRSAVETILREMHYQLTI